MFLVTDTTVLPSALAALTAAANSAYPESISISMTEYEAISSAPAVSWFALLFPPNRPWGPDVPPIEVEVAQLVNESPKTTSTANNTNTEPFLAIEFSFSAGSAKAHLLERGRRTAFI